jgi:hypothetical protein
MNSLSYDLDYNGTPNPVYINAGIRNGKKILRGVFHNIQEIKRDASLYRKSVCQTGIFCDVLSIDRHNSELLSPSNLALQLNSRN